MKELGAQVQDLSRQLKTMGSQVQGIASHVQHLSATASGLNANTRRWLEEKETAMLMPEKPRMEAMKIRKDSEAVSGPRVSAQGPGHTFRPSSPLCSPGWS